MKELKKEINESFIKEKLRTLEYAEAFYKAMCNVIWEKENITNSFSFREAGRLVAELREMGESYLDFYPSLAGDKEGTITPEIKEDLSKLGWNPTYHTFAHHLHNYPS